MKGDGRLTNNVMYCEDEEMNNRTERHGVFMNLPTLLDVLILLYGRCSHGTN